METPEKFLPEKYPDLPGSKPVERAVRKKLSKGEKGPQTKEGRVKAYLDRLESLIKDKRAFERLKYKILAKYTTKQNEVPESYWKLQERIMRERGQQGDWENAMPEQQAELKRQNLEGVLADQKSSLEQWVDYFVLPDSDYIPQFLKYWVFRNVIGLSEYDKEKREFPKRSKGTVKQFPDINYESLSYVIDAVLKKLKGTDIEFEYDIQPEERQVFLKFLEKEDFAKLYAWANELMNPAPERLLLITEWIWRKYPKNSDYMALVKSIRGKGTGWCTAGENTAKKQLEDGDFYCFYSLDDEAKPTIPRIAIRMEGDKIAEVRGVAYKQNLDPYVGAVLAKKLDEFPDKAEYLKKDRDMQRLTEIDNKIKKSELLNREDLIFLYEIDAPIEGFGYQRDPRIAELRKQRNPEQDMLIVFECGKDQIAHGIKKINEGTKAYVGPLVPGVFDKIQEYNIEHVYTSFPEGCIRQETIEIGGKDAKTLIKEMLDKNIEISPYVMDMMESKDFTTLEKAEFANFIRLKVRDLGFPKNKYPTIDEIYKRIKKLGLELCPLETGPRYRLQYANQPLNEWLRIGMKQIAVRDFLHVFSLERHEDGLWLDDARAGPNKWNPDDGLVLRLHLRSAKRATVDAVQNLKT